MVHSDKGASMVPAFLITLALAACQPQSSPASNASAGGGGAAVPVAGVGPSDPTNRLIGKWLAGPECGKDAGGRFEFTKTQMSIWTPDATKPETNPVTYTSITPDRISFTFFDAPFTAGISADDQLSLPLLPCRMHRVG